MTKKIKEIILLGGSYGALFSSPKFFYKPVAPLELKVIESIKSIRKIGSYDAIFEEIIIDAGRRKELQRSYLSIAHSREVQWLRRSLLSLVQALF